MPVPRRPGPEERPHGAAAREGGDLGAAGPVHRGRRKRPLSPRVGGSRRDRAAALQPPLDPAAAAGALRAVASAGTALASGPARSPGARRERARRCGRGDGDSAKARQRRSRARRRRAGCGCDARASSPRRRRGRAAPGVRCALARLASRPGSAQGASRRAPRACRARKRRPIRRLVPPLRARRGGERGGADRGPRRLLRPRSATAARRRVAAGGDGRARSPRPSPRRGALGPALLVPPRGSVDARPFPPRGPRRRHPPGKRLSQPSRRRMVAAFPGRIARMDHAPATCAVTAASDHGADLMDSKRTTGETEDRTPRTGSASPVRRISVVEIRDPRTLSGFVPAWEALAAAAIEPNVFYEPWMLLPALRAFGDGKDIRIVLVLIHDPRCAEAAPRLAGLFPLERIRNFRSLRVSALSLWQHVHCY